MQWGEKTSFNYKSYQAGAFVAVVPIKTKADFLEEKGAIAVFVDFANALLGQEPIERSL